MSKTNVTNLKKNGKKDVVCYFEAKLEYPMFKLLLKNFLFETVDLKKFNNKASDRMKTVITNS